MRERGIIFRDDMDMSRLSDVKKFSGRLTAATLMKLSLAEHLAGEYDGAPLSRQRPHHP